MRIKIKLILLIVVFASIFCEGQANVISNFIAKVKSKIFGEKHLSPVIFVPGDGGSQIDAKLDKPEVVHYLCSKKTDDYFNIWLNLELLFPVIIDCWIDNVKLSYDNATRKTYNSPGVETRIPGWGDSEVVEWLDPSHAGQGAYFKDVGNALTANGWQRNVSIRGAPYDFRKAPNELKQWFLDMKILVEETYNMNEKTPITFIVHSMGGPMTVLFLQQQSDQWKEKYVKRIISLAGAWAGSAKAVKVFAIGDDLGAYALKGSVMRAAQITSPSLSWLLPSPLFWKPNEVIVKTQRRVYTMAQMEDYFNDLGYRTGWEMRVDTLRYTMDFTAPNVEIHCLYGSKIDTVEVLNYEKSYDFSGTPKLEFGNGDGTVNTRSLEACQYWKDKQKPSITLQEYPGVDHMNILSASGVIDYIMKVMLSDIS